MSKIPIKNQNGGNCLVKSEQTESGSGRAPPQSPERFEAELAAINPRGAERRQEMAELRRRMDEACDRGALTISQWRLLIDKVAAARAEAPVSRPPARLP